MRILKILGRFLICILCICLVCNTSFAGGNVPYGDISEHGNWINPDNMDKFKTSITTDMNRFQNEFQQNVESSNFVPLEVKIGLAFMRALSSIDYVLQISLVRFTIIFLFIMYAFWIGLQAYKMIRESTDYKTVFYDIFKKGMLIAVWIMILEYGPAKLFTMLMNPILAFGTYLSNFILDAVAQSYDVNMHDTCATIHQYVNENTATAITTSRNQLLVSPDTAANIMCLPGRISTYFYQATATAWKWMIKGFSTSPTQIIVGGVCVVIFIKCIFKYAFMTLGVVADLFLKLLMLPFTALAEALPSSSEKGYFGQVFNGFLKVFNAQKLSAVIASFVNATIYFVSLAIVIAICAALLSNIVGLSDVNQYTTGRAMITILCGALVLHLANKADELAKKIGGNIDNSFGTKLQSDAKTLWGDVKNVGGKVYKDWIKKK